MEQGSSAELLWGIVLFVYLVLCGIFCYYIDKATQKIIEESGLREEDENQLQWMVSAMALPIFLLAPILYFSGMQDQLIHWMVWKKIEKSNLIQSKGG